VRRSPEDARRIRDAASRDVPRIRSIFRAASLSNAGDRDALLSHPEHLEWDAAGRVRVALEEADILGFAAVVIAGELAELVDLFVDPAAMRRGVGLALTRDAAGLAAHAGCSALAVTANPHAAAFYAAAGFCGEHHVTTPLGRARRLHLALPARTG
jgi:N-acetylglutamate synthase-like GNAT family acetyltransferase